MEAADMTGSRLLERKVTNGKKISYGMVSAVGMDITQNVPQDFSYLAFCRNGVETRCTFCVTSYKMYSQPWRSNKFVSLCEVF
jgi:hypothetical protein